MGRVRSSHFREGRILKAGCGNKKPYYKVVLQKGSNKYTKNVHVLVAEAFLGYTSYKETRKIVDHIDNNPANNTSINLQIVSYRVNNFKDKPNKGVSWHKVKKKWVSRVWFSGKRYNLGRFETKDDAQLMYKEVFNMIEDGKFDVEKFKIYRKQKRIERNLKYKNEKVVS